MTSAEAIFTIRECIDAERVEVKAHFADRIAQRGLVWADVLAIVEHWSHARNDGLDVYGRPRWLIRGKAADDLTAEFLCVLDWDDSGNLTVFITIYFED